MMVKKLKPVSLVEVRRIMDALAIETGRIKRGETYFYSTAEIREVLSKR